MINFPESFTMVIAEIFDKGTKNIHWIKDNLVNKSCWEKRITTCPQMEVILLLHFTYSANNYWACALCLVFLKYWQQLRLYYLSPGWPDSPQGPLSSCSHWKFTGSTIRTELTVFHFDHSSAQPHPYTSPLSLKKYFHLIMTFWNLVQVVGSQPVKGLIKNKKNVWKSPSCCWLVTECCSMSQEIQGCSNGPSWKKSPWNKGWEEKDKP